MKRQVGKAAAAFLVLASAAATRGQAQTFTTLHSFNGTDGGGPIGLVQATDGNFYGTTIGGGTSSACSTFAFGCGTVYKITPPGTLTTLHSFDFTDGQGPQAALIQATDGNLYGTTTRGGAFGAGTVFKITPSGTLTTLHSFDGTDGINIVGGVVQGSDGNFYGTARDGGANDGGTVFKITPGGTFTTLYSFCSQGIFPHPCTDGFEPFAGLVQASDGNFYGTTNGGGAGFGGTVFKITPTGTLTTLHSFDGADGSGPGGLVQATDGNFYGNTSGGGANGAGTVFKITPAGTVTTLHSFNGADGSAPSGLLQATDGNFYGTAFSGGGNSACLRGCGTVFSLSVGLASSPTISSISPTSAVLGLPANIAILLTVNGSGFVSGSTVSFNGNALPTNFVSSMQLGASLFGFDITTGTFSVIVTNPVGGTSNAVSFTVVTPQDATQTIINAVNTLFSQGVINGGQDNSLVVQLQHAISMMNAGKNAGAIGNLDFFISEVNDLLSSGVLSPSQAVSLVSEAESVIAAI